jgi:hypothetical protein
MKNATRNPKEVNPASKEKLKRKVYEKELARLHVELVKL